MAKRKSQKTTIDPETGDLREGAEAAGPRRSGILGALSRVAKDAVVRRTSTKR